MIPFIILLVIFVVVMVMWAANAPGDVRAKWLAWTAVLILGIVVFLVGTGVIVVEKTSIAHSY